MGRWGARGRKMEALLSDLRFIAGRGEKRHERRREGKYVYTTRELIWVATSLALVVGQRRNETRPARLF